MTTIRRRLLAGMTCATLACSAGAGLVLYRSLCEEVNELADLQLRQVALALPDEFAPRTGGPAPEDPEEQFSVQAWNAGGVAVHASRLPPYPLLPRQDLAGFRTLHHGGHAWRVYGVDRHGLHVQVAQPLAVRNRLATSMALRTGAPLLAFAILLTTMAWLVVRSALRPLNRLAASVAGRSPSMLDRLAVDECPAELVPVVRALNALLERFAHTLATQRTFVADAAHELRSPLTALKLQLQLAQKETDDATRQRALARLHVRLDRAAHVVEQLLDLALHEGGYASSRKSWVDLRSLVEQAVSDHAELAEARGIDLGVASSLPLAIQGHRDGLQCMLDNLVDNALRYTPGRGRVDLALTRQAGAAILSVADDGPGIAPEHRDRIFDRFYRPEGQDAPGCGLGLSIARNIAAHHGAEIALLPGIGGRGLTASVRFPVADRDHDSAGGPHAVR